MSIGDLDQWKALAEPASVDLLDRMKDMDLSRPTAIARLRSTHSPELVSAAIELTLARSKSGHKFPDHPDLWADRAGLEQATSALVARHKARRFADLKPSTIIDLCSGIGGDAQALQHAAPVMAVDSDPIRCWMTQQNAGCETHTGLVEDFADPITIFHLDPARRTSSGARLWRYSDCIPGPEFIEALLERCPDGAVKLGPGVDSTELPSPIYGEIEIISEHGTLVQAILWAGALARNPSQRTATMLPENISFTGIPTSPQVRYESGFDRYLHIPHPALERAELVGAHPLADTFNEAHHGLGLLTSDEPIDDPWFTSYEILAPLPWRPTKIKAWLRTHDGGPLTVRTRGKAINPDIVQRQFTGSGSTPYTLFGLRLGLKQIALISTPVSR